MIANKLAYLPIGSARYFCTPETDCRFIQEYQLKDRALWKKFVNVFRTRPDGEMGEWRGEYWGKMMRGACMTYRYTADKELYDVLTETVKDLLTTQDDGGTFSSYPPDKQYTEWDVWGRKYVLSSLLYFYDICTDEALKTDVLRAAERHLDVLARDLGNGVGQRSVLSTSQSWGALNSCSILEVVLDAYSRLPKPEYLALARHLVDCGGSASGNMIAAALDDNLLPADHPVPKSYEALSYYEGVLEYYRLTGENKYLDAVTRVVDLVDRHENTEIGALGVHKEEWDHSTKKQTQPSPHVGLETCVTVTWMRLLAKLYLLTGDKRYVDQIDLSAHNGLRGAINFEKQIFYNEHRLVCDFVDALPFDSYSPVLATKRGRVVAGFLRLAEGGNYGCCASIGSAGTALVPLLAVCKTADGYAVNSYYAGEVNAEEGFAFSMQGEYPVCGDVILTITKSDGSPRALDLRIPDWCSSAEIDGKPYTPQDGYVRLSRAWKQGEQVRIALSFGITKKAQDGLTAYRYGTITLARDNAKEKTDDLLAPLTGCGAWQRVAPEKGERVRFLLPHDSGTAVFTDYASCGRNWLDKDSRVTVWHNVK